MCDVVFNRSALLPAGSTPPVKQVPTLDCAASNRESCLAKNKPLRRDLHPIALLLVDFCRVPVSVRMRVFVDCYRWATSKSRARSNHQGNRLAGQYEQQINMVARFACRKALPSQGAHVLLGMKTWIMLPDEISYFDYDGNEGLTTAAQSKNIAERMTAVLKIRWFRCSVSYHNKIRCMSIPEAHHWHGRCHDSVRLVQELQQVCAKGTSVCIACTLFSTVLGQTAPPRRLHHHQTSPARYSRH